jgi:hypothetical protein
MKRIALVALIALARRSTAKGRTFLSRPVWRVHEEEEIGRCV